MTVKKMPLLSGILGVFLSSVVLAAPTSAVQLCTSMGCKDANRVATPVDLYHRLGELFTKNTGRKITICDADPSIHLCFQQKLELKASSPIMAANISVDAADMVSVNLSQDETSLTALLDIPVEANGTYPSCGTAQARAVVGDYDKVSIVIDNFGCAFTSTLVSDLNMGFAIDYIDFEKAVIGGYYTFSSSGAVRGMRSGYALLRFAEPVSSEFTGDVSGVDMFNRQSVVDSMKRMSETEDKECAPCIAEKIRDDAAVRSAIEAAAHAEAEAKAAAERAVKMAEEAAQTTSEYAQKKAEEAEKAKQEAEKAAEMALEARSRVDNKVAAIQCQGVKRYDDNGNEIEPTFTEKVSETLNSVTDTVGNTWDKVTDPVVEAWNPEEPFSEKWNRWMDKASKVFWLEEPLF